MKIVKCIAAVLTAAVCRKSLAEFRAAQARNKMESFFRRHVRRKNSLRGASVEMVRFQRTNEAQSAACSKKRQSHFFDTLAAVLTAAVWLSALTGCSHSRSSKLVNEISFSLDGISEVTISYDEEKVTFYEGEGDELTVKEYMTEGKSGYFAKVERGGGHIRIREGGKPFFKDGFYRRVEVYLPACYCENLTVTTTDGDIDLSELEISLNTLRIDSTSGTVRLNAVEAQAIDLSTTSGMIDADCLRAEGIKITTTSGSFLCEKLYGYVAYTTTSGNADITSAVGEGNYRANNSGELNLIYTEVTGDLSFYNKNGGIQVTLPAALEFEFEAATKNGSISTSFQECVSFDGRTASGTVGERPTVTVKVETNNGNAEIKQGSGGVQP